MKLLVYCQHVLGIGHLMRTLAILRALGDEEITLVTGGPESGVRFPAGIRHLRLPALMMDSDFSRLQTVDRQSSPEELRAVKEERRRLLRQAWEQARPDILLIELYPFGRNGFRFELEPLLTLCRQGTRRCLTVCSVRDILVERDNPAAFEQRVVERLNRWFDLLLVHSDPAVLPLELTFSRVADIAIPMAYTGFVRQKPPPGADRLPAIALAAAPGVPLIVASAGSGSVGASLLEAAVRAHALLPLRTRLQVFTGPHLPEEDFHRLTGLAGPDTTIARFSDAFPAWLAAADLSLSMGGYNTTMDLLATGCPALIHPFPQNREQRLRAERLRSHAPIDLLGDEDLEPARLAARILSMLGTRRTGSGQLCLDGAATTAGMLRNAMKERR